MCIFIFSTNLVENISHSNKNSARYFHYFFIGVHVKCPSACRILIQIEFPRQIVEKTSNFVKIHRVEDELFHADRKTGGQRDMMHLIVTFRNLAQVPINSQDLMTCCCLINVPTEEVSVA
jgi:hypothetical protein